MELHVGVGDCIITQNPADVLKTFSLATCVGVTAYSPRNRVAGMLHIMLPSCPDDASRILRPYYYASSGLPLFLEKLLSAHCIKSDIEFRVYGGASSSCKEDCFRIGTRNLIEIENLLIYHKLYYKMVDVAGNVSRTLIMDSLTGNVTVNIQKF
jgi:chemotaxis protein CheD